MTLQEIITRLKRIEEKLDKLIVPDDPTQHPDYEQFEVDEVECYISNSGNKTWKAFSVAGELIYLRQSHRDMLTAAGLWDDLNAMKIGEARNSNLTIGTVPDGDFKKPVMIVGVVYDPDPTEEKAGDLPF